uniref:Ground-like domain-containing protein n=1 Tax=Steinernema glaseri TaxID=37863 RepID=A0A1I7ZXC9_9BILA
MNPNLLPLIIFCPLIVGQLSGKPLSKGALKTELLANLNKHSDTDEQKLEMWSPPEGQVPPVSTTTAINLFGGAPRIFDPPFSLINEPPGGKPNPMKPTKPKTPPHSIGFQFQPTVSSPDPRAALSPEHADDIRNWRQRFYRVFKNRAAKKQRKVAREPPKVVVHMNDTTQPQIDKNFQVLMTRKDPSWLSEDKVKAFARDKKGHIIRLFGVESSGYRYNFTQPELPAASYQSMSPPSRGPVYIPAANIPSQPPLQPGKYEEASVYTSRAPTSFHSFATQTPEPIRLLSVFAPTTLAPPVMTAVGGAADSILTSEVDASPDYSNVRVEQQSDCPMGQCDTEQGGMESHDKCNSARLQALIQNNIVAGDAEGSKRAIQTQAELEFSQFFNVVCGTGFFSYIAHTDEFCQASAGGVNCYAFSPVCSLRPAPGPQPGPPQGVPQMAPAPLMGLGDLGMPMGLPFGRARKKAVVNRN